MTHCLSCSRHISRVQAEDACSIFGRKFRSFRTPAPPNGSPIGPPRSFAPLPVRTSTARSSPSPVRIAATRAGAARPAFHRLPRTARKAKRRQKGTDAALHSSDYCDRIRRHPRSSTMALRRYRGLSHLRALRRRSPAAPLAPIKTPWQCPGVSSYC